MAADIADVMADIAAALDFIPGLRVYAHPPKSAQPPFAFVDVPDRIEFDCAMQRGCDRASLNVVVGVADVVDRSSIEQILTYSSSSHINSIKTTLEAVQIGQSLRVVEAHNQPVNLAGQSYFGAVFELDIVY